MSLFFKFRQFFKDKCFIYIGTTYVYGDIMSEYTNNLQSSFTVKMGLNNLIETSRKILTGKLTSADIETLSIVFNIEQFQMIMQSLDEARSGQIVSIQEAFEDLN
ncbi:MAG: hypothetical protein A2104_06630 [Candidatus Melainabacteria bacterium GWF2_32_7]|nr:MAG: hypothetical protein A2104_06630 [Candidatus Melainabacteria bacterium GWF2_32_7]